jgi:hypothetical protein
MWEIQNLKNGIRGDQLKYTSKIPAQVIRQLAVFSEDTESFNPKDTWDILISMMLGITWSEETHQIAKVASDKIMEELKRHYIKG